MSQPDPIWPRPQLTIPRGPTAGLRWRLDLDWRIDWGGPDWNAGDLDWGMAPRRITMRSPIVQILLAGYELPQAPPPPEAPPWWLDTRANWWHRDAPPKKPKPGNKGESTSLRAPAAPPQRDAKADRPVLAADRDGFGAGLRAGKPLPMSSRRPEVLVGGPENPSAAPIPPAVPRSLHAAARALTPDPESRKQQVSLRPPPATRAPAAPPSTNTPRTPSPAATETRPPTPDLRPPAAGPRNPTRPAGTSAPATPLRQPPPGAAPTTTQPPRLGAAVPSPTGVPGSLPAVAPTSGRPPSAAAERTSPGPATPARSEGPEETGPSGPGGTTLLPASPAPPRPAPLEPPAGWGGLRSPFSAALHPRIEAQDLALAWGSGGQPKTLRSNAPQVMVSAEAPAPEPTARPPLRPAWPPLPPPGSGLPGGWGQKKPRTSQAPPKEPAKKAVSPPRPAVQENRGPRGRESEAHPPEPRATTRTADPRGTDTRRPESRTPEARPLATPGTEPQSVQTRPQAPRGTDTKAPDRAPQAGGAPTPTGGPPSPRQHPQGTNSQGTSGSNSVASGNANDRSTEPPTARPAPSPSQPQAAPSTSARGQTQPAEARPASPGPLAEGAGRSDRNTAASAGVPTSPTASPTASQNSRYGQGPPEGDPPVWRTPATPAEEPLPKEAISWRAPAQERGRAHRPLLSAGGPEAWTETGASPWRGTDGRTGSGGAGEGGFPFLDANAPTWGTAQRKFVRLRGLNAQPVLLGAPAAAASPVVEDARGHRIPITPWPERTASPRTTRAEAPASGAQKVPAAARTTSLEAQPPARALSRTTGLSETRPAAVGSTSGGLRAPAPILPGRNTGTGGSHLSPTGTSGPEEVQVQRPVTESRGVQTNPAGATTWQGLGQAKTGRALDLRSPSPFHRVIPRIAGAPGGVVQPDLAPEAVAWGPDQRRFTRGNLGAPRVLLGAPEAPDLSRPEPGRAQSARGFALEPWPDRGSPWARSSMATRPGGSSPAPDNSRAPSPNTGAPLGAHTQERSPVGPRRSWRNDPRGDTPTLRSAWSQSAGRAETPSRPRAAGEEASGQAPSSPFARSTQGATPGGGGVPREQGAPAWGPDQRSFIRGRLGTGATPYLSVQTGPPPPSEGAWSEPILRDPTGRTIRNSPFGAARAESTRLRAPAIPGRTEAGPNRGQRPTGQATPGSTSPTSPAWRGTGEGGIGHIPEGRKSGGPVGSATEPSQASPHWGRRKLTQAASHRPMTLVDAREDAAPPEAPVWRSPSWWERSRAGSPEVERWARAAGDRPGTVRNLRVPQNNRPPTRSAAPEAPPSTAPASVELGGLRGRRRTLAAPIGAGVRWLDAPGFGPPPPPPPKPAPPPVAKPPPPPPPASKPPPPPTAWEAPKGRNDAPTSPTNRSRRPPPPRSGRPPNLPPWDPNKIPDRPPFPTEDEIKAGPGPSRAPFPQEGEDGWIPDGAKPLSEGSPGAPPPQWNAPGFTPPPGAPNAPGQAPPPLGTNPPSDRSFTHLAPTSGGASDGIVDNEPESTAGGPARKRAAAAASPPGINTLTERQMYQVIVELAHRNPAVRRLLLEIQDEVQSLIELERSRRF